MKHGHSIAAFYSVPVAAVSSFRQSAQCWHPYRSPVYFRCYTSNFMSCNQARHCFSFADMKNWSSLLVIKWFSCFITCADLMPCQDSSLLGRSSM